MESFCKHILLLNIYPVRFSFLISKPITMNKESIMKADVLDIIFENRNKSYGAYILRKFYADRVKRSLSIMLLMVLVCVVFILFSPKTKKIVDKLYTATELEITKVADKIKEPEKIPEPVKPKQSLAVTPQQQYSTNLKIVDSTAVIDSIKTLKDVTIIGSTNVVVSNPGPATVQPVTSSNGDNKEPVKAKLDKNIPLEASAVDIPPSYPGGMDALRKFLEKNLASPKEMEEGESVSVKIRFVVGYDGRLQSFVTVEDGGQEFNKEVVRVLKKMPDWIPGKAKGENVSVYYTIPVKFIPQN
jgi:periplasmic protein TonB